MKDNEAIDYLVKIGQGKKITKAEKEQLLKKIKQRKGRVLTRKDR